jgi:chitodextrinase
VNNKLLPTDTLTAPPSQPSIPIIESSGATWAFISWNAPLMADSSISHYEIMARAIDHDEIMTIETNTSATSFNVTGLLPGTTYELTVVAVSQGGGINARSLESDSVVFRITRQGMSINFGQ